MTHTPSPLTPGLLQLQSSKSPEEMSRSNSGMCPHSPHSRKLTQDSLVKLFHGLKSSSDAH